MTLYSYANRLHDALYDDYDLVAQSIISYCQRIQAVDLNSEADTQPTAPRWAENGQARTNRWLQVEPTPDERAALTRLWQSYVLLIAKVIAHSEIPRRWQIDALQDSYEIFARAVSGWDADRGTLKSYLFRVLPRDVRSLSYYYRADEENTHVSRDNDDLKLPTAPEVETVGPTPDEVDDTLEGLGLLEDYQELVANL